MSDYSRGFVSMSKKNKTLKWQFLSNDKAFVFGMSHIREYSIKWKSSSIENKKGFLQSFENSFKRQINSAYKILWVVL